MGTDVLSHAVTPDGWPAPEFGYHGPEAGCPVHEVPGSGQPVYLLRSWKSVLAALRFPLIRDLQAVTSRHALAGVTLQRDGGLLRRTTPAADELREVLNPVWRPAACEPYRPVLRQLAAWRAAAALGTGGGPADLAAAFVTPYIHDVIMLAAGLGDLTQAAELTGLSDRTTGALLYRPDDHTPVAAAWDELYDFTAAAISQAQAPHERRPDSPAAQALAAAGLLTVPSLLAQSITALQAAGLPPGELHEAVTTIHNGIPTTGPALGRIADQLLEHPEVMAACRADPRLAGRVVREGMRRAAHFTFALPGITQVPVTLDGTRIPAGSAVLPVIHAAEHARTPDPRHFDLARSRRATLAWGAGTHACLGRHLAVIALEEAVAEIAALRLRRAAVTAWQQGTMPVRDLPVLPATAACPVPGVSR